MVALYPVFGEYFLTVLYTSLLSFYFLPILNIFESSTTFISGTFMKEHAKMVTFSPQVNIIILVHLSTTMLYSSVIR